MGLTGQGWTPCSGCGRWQVVAGVQNESVAGLREYLLILRGGAKRRCWWGNLVGQVSESGGHLHEEPRCTNSCFVNMVTKLG